ncbi:MAG TPA: FtsQ-type POTRA domain-containing protein [Bryobacteraceae bacterium]|nr:FtsQ-type POTRA domain-containing protein [Bryobacteraceae bacterium]
MPRESKPRPKRWNWRLVFSIAALALVGVSTAVAALKVRRFVVTDPQFNLSRSHKDALTLEGVHYASRSKISRVFAPDFDRSIFAISLDARRRELLALDWVADASVSRMWPDRLLVRIRERQPIAFVSSRSGVLLIDASGVLLDPPPQAQFTFPVLSGVREKDPPEQRRDRVRTFLRVQEEMGYLLKDVSEVDVADPDNIRLVAQVGNRALELLLGDMNFARRYQNFLAHYPEIQKRSPGAKLFDLRLDDRITVKE